MSDITKDVKRLCDICYQVGYMGAVIDRVWSDDAADNICEYITDLFNAKRDDEVDMIPVETYEREINELKDQVERLRDMYQMEHMKLVKEKTEHDSHHPMPNIYADDWRRP